MSGSMGREVLEARFHWISDVRMSKTNKGALE